MMIDRTDEEMGELVRAWLQRYGLTILAGIVIAIAILSGSQWWHNHQLAARGEVTAQLLAMNDAVAAGDVAQAKALYSRFDDNSEAQALAALLMASLDGDDGQATAYLETATHSNDPLVAQTAHWQLAQAQIGAGDYAAAQHSLQALKGSAYENQIALLHAVIAQQEGNDQQAMDAYEKALSQNPESSAFITAQMAAVQGALAVASAEEK